MPRSTEDDKAVRPAPSPFPDRALTPEPELPTLQIRGGGHRMSIFKKMVQGPRPGPRPRDGDLVRVVDPAAAFVGYGLWNYQSQVALRMLSRQQEPPGPEFWHQRLERAVRLRLQDLDLDHHTNAYRLIHAEGDGLSGLVIDRFADVLSVEVFSLGMYQRVGPILDWLHTRLGTSHGRLRMDAAIGRAEGFNPRAIDSVELPAQVAITEHGVRYRVRFEGAHKTGFFCDQRPNRLALRRLCAGRSMLDLCCYTGGFALNALMHGGATEATCVDLDESALAIARENANLNQVKPKLVHSDAFGYSRQMLVNGKKYGVVVLDPPKLIPSRDDIPTGKRKYADLNALAMQIVEDDGFLVTCSCSGLLPRDEFLHLLRSAAWRAGRSAQVLQVTGAGGDHPVRLDAPESEYLKVVWLKLGAGEEPANQSQETNENRD